MSAAAPQAPAFDGNAVTVTITLNRHAVNLILAGLEQLPIRDAGAFYFHLKREADLVIEGARLAYESQLKAPPQDSPSNTAATAAGDQQ